MKLIVGKERSGGNFHVRAIKVPESDHGVTLMNMNQSFRDMELVGWFDLGIVTCDGVER